MSSFPITIRYLTNEQAMITSDKVKAAQAAIGDVQTQLTDVGNNAEALEKSPQAVALEQSAAQLQTTITAAVTALQALGQSITPA